VNTLDQLYQRSQREIEAHIGVAALCQPLGDLNEPTHYRLIVIDAVTLLASMRFWAQLDGKDDQAIREIFESPDPAAGLKEAGRQLEESGTPEELTASGLLTKFADERRPEEPELMEVITTALRAL
jgi:hypothetical protein